METTEAWKSQITLVKGQDSDRRLQILHDAGQPLDHPVPAAFSEGCYLKCVVSRVSMPV